jgi:ABC-type transporter MlaC component/preprotein translocase subunit SecF
MTSLGLMLVRTGGAVGASALVLIAAALATTVADLPAIAELGIISAAGLALSLLASYTVFPALLVLDRPTEDHPTGAPVLARPTAAVSAPASGRLARRLGQARWALVAGVLLTLAAGGLALWRPPAFDSNLLNLQARESESVRYERLLIAEGGLSTSFVLTDAADLAEATRKSEALRSRPLVGHVESALDVIPEAQPAKAQTIRAIRPLLTDIDVRRDAASAFALEPFRSAVSRLAFKLGAASDKGKGTAEARKALVDLLGTIDRVGASTAAARLAAAQAALLEEFADGLAFLKANLKPAPITPDSLPEGLRARFTGESGRLLLRIHPKENTWERAAMARFLADVRTVEPGVTGPRVQGFEVTEAIGRDYARATVVALVAIGLLTLFLFRNVKEALLAVIPLAAGGLWTLGVMAAFGIDFNLANLFAVPLVIGVAVDSGVNLVGRAREERAEAMALLGRSVGKSVLLASLTTIWGFAALLPAHHRGIASLGLLLTLGAALTSLAAFIVLPPAIGAVARYRAARQAQREGTLAAAAAILVFFMAAGGALVAGFPGGIRTASAAPATVGAVDAVRGTIEATRAIMRDPALKPKTRDERIRRLIAERFDTEAMGRAALGPHDEQLAAGQRAEYTDLFATLFTRSYSRMVLSFLDRVQVRYGDAAPADEGMVVSTTLLKSRGETLPVEYRLKPRDDGWTFTDVVIDGLSLVASYRSQFDQVIRTNGTGSLLDRMRARRDRER